MTKVAPIRTCVLCRKKFNKYKLHRYVIKFSEQEIASIEDERHSGRGYYHCSEQECIERFPLLRWFRKRKKGEK